MSRSLTFHLETKMLWHQTPSQKKKAIGFTNVIAKAYYDQLNAGFSKVCEIFNVCGIESLKYIREFHTHTGLLLWRHFHAPKRDAERNENLIGCLTCRSNSFMCGPWPVNADIYT